MTINESRVTAPDVKSVAVIGGGASGAIALDALLAEQKFDRITVFERRDRLGGVWALDEDYGETIVEPGLSERELDPPLKVPEQLRKSAKVKVPRNGQIRFERSPGLYEDLRTNVPQRVMTYSDNKKWPFLAAPQEEELTTLRAVDQYIKEYFAKNKDAPGVSLNFNTFIERILKVDHPEGIYEVVLRTVSGDSDEWSVHYFDAIVVATGHYHVPHVPYVQGLKELGEKFPGIAVHSKGFHKFEQYSGKPVIVVGGHSSSVDVVRELKKVGAKITWSRNDIEETSTEFETLRRPVITHFETTASGDIVVHYKDGTREENPAKIVYATGYFYSYPFLRELDPNITEKTIIPNVFQHTFHIKYPTIAFVGTARNGMSFRVFEYQTVLATRFFAGKITLPPVEDQIQWRDNRIKERGYEHGAYHRTDLDPAIKYIEEVVELGGGYDAIGTGRAFPKFSETDIAVYETNRERLHARWSGL